MEVSREFLPERKRLPLVYFFISTYTSSKRNERIDMEDPYLPHPDISSDFILFVIHEKIYASWNTFTKFVTKSNKN